MTTSSLLHLAIPKGRMADGVHTLLSDAGCPVQTSGRDYRASIPIQGVSTKILKPQSIVEMLSVGRRDLGFAGADWVAELEADVVEVLDTGLNPVQVVVAAPNAFLVDGRLPSHTEIGRPLIIASEYQTLAKQWMATQPFEGHFIRSWGATEVLPPEDADCIIDNTATGATLRANQLTILDQVMTSTTRLYASRQAMQDPQKVEKIQEIVLVLKSVLQARKRMMVEVNVSQGDLASLLEVLPSMRCPTISPLYGEAGYAVKSAVPKEGLAELIPRLKKAGATDLVVSRIDQIVM